MASRTLAAFRPQETEAIVKVLGTVSARLIDQEVVLASRQEGRLTLK